MGEMGEEWKDEALFKPLLIPSSWESFFLESQTLFAFDTCDSIFEVFYVIMSNIVHKVKDAMTGHHGSKGGAGDKASDGEFFCFLCRYIIYLGRESCC